MKRIGIDNSGLKTIGNSPKCKRIIRLISASTLAFLACCVITLLAVGAFNPPPPVPSFNIAAPVKTVVAQPDVTPPVLQTQKASRVDGEVLTIHPYGFDQSEITRPAGRFFLIVDDRSGLESTSLAIRAEASTNALREVSLSRERTDWDELLDLPPGRYVLAEANHSGWVCNLTITAK